MKCPRTKFIVPIEHLKQERLLVGKELIYRGARYKLTPACAMLTPSKVGIRLIYRGVTYEISSAVAS